MASLRIDEKGRITLPAQIREDLDLQPGDTSFYEREDRVLRVAKAVNPFDAPAAEAVREYREGRTRRLQPATKAPDA